MKHVVLLLLASLFSFVTFAQVGPITGDTATCVGTYTGIYLSDATTGGTWSSSVTTVATVSRTGGNVYGVSAGTTTITYSTSSGYATTTITIAAHPSPIFGLIYPICSGTNVTLSNTVSGGVWSTSNSLIATINSSTGVVTPVGSGAINIIYTTYPGCITESSVSIAGPITGSSAVCTGSTVTLSVSAYGTWTSSNTAVATTTAGPNSSTTVHGITAGTTTISCIISSGCSESDIVTVSNCGGLPAITGGSVVCTGSASNLSDATAGGTWFSSNTAVATVSSSGMVYGLTAGVANIFYAASGDTVGYTVTASNCGPPAITGRDTVCIGTTTSLSDTTAGGVWSSTNTTHATVSGTGVVTGLLPGVDTISYTVSGASVTMVMHILTAAQCTGVASPITGGSSLCVGATLNLSDATTGGTWSTSNTTIATINSSGVAYGVTRGSVNVSYTASGISAVLAVTVYNPGTVVGVATVLCTGANLELSDYTASSGGTWTSSNTTVATISYSGFDASVYGIVPGTTTISYTTPGGCSSTYTVTVSSSVTPGAISGTSTIYTGGDTAHLYETGPGGTWSSGTTTVAVIDPTTGIYTGVSAGTSLITYTLTGCSGTSYATYSVTVTPISGISGHVYFSGPPYSGNVKVWLITYNPSTLNLEAIDSASVSGSGTTGIYYQFPAIATDSYRVKAAVAYTYSVTTTGNMPTYHTSSIYWNTANVINHTAGTADINEDITALTGSVTTGPGFIGGNVTTGANRGTNTGIPAIALNIYLFNSSTGALMQLTTTDTGGNYSFSDIPTGTYYVFPDSLNYITTAYTGITLTSGSATMTTANFIQHTISKTITPYTTGVGNVQMSRYENVTIYPNPAQSILNIVAAPGLSKGEEVIHSVAISNLLGQTVFRQDAGAASSLQVNVAAFPAGVYFVKINGSMIRKFVKQ